MSYPALERRHFIVLRYDTQSHKPTRYSPMNTYGSKNIVFCKSVNDETIIEGSKVLFSERSYWSLTPNKYAQNPTATGPAQSARLCWGCRVSRRNHSCITNKTKWRGRLCASHFGAREKPQRTASRTPGLLRRADLHTIRQLIHILPQEMETAGYGKDW
jgi:hypothetical protein